MLMFHLSWSILRQILVFIAKYTGMSIIPSHEWEIKHDRIMLNDGRMVSNDGRMILISPQSTHVNSIQSNFMLIYKNVGVRIKPLQFQSVLIIGVVTWPSAAVIWTLLHHHPAFHLLMSIIGITGLILCLHPANERRPNKVTPSIICWAQSWIEPWHNIWRCLANGTCVYRPSEHNNYVKRWLWNNSSTIRL